MLQGLLPTPFAPSLVSVLFPPVSKCVFLPMQQPELSQQPVPLWPFFNSEETEEDMEVDDPVEDFDLFDTFDMLSSGPNFDCAVSLFHVSASFIK